MRDEKYAKMAKEIYGLYEAKGEPGAWHREDELKKKGGISISKQARGSAPSAAAAPLCAATLLLDADSRGAAPGLASQGSVEPQRAARRGAPYPLFAGTPCLGQPGLRL